MYLKGLFSFHRRNEEKNKTFSWWRARTLLRAPPYVMRAIGHTLDGKPCDRLAMLVTVYVHLGSLLSTSQQVPFEHDRYCRTIV